MNDKVREIFYLLRQALEGRDFHVTADNRAVGFDDYIVCLAIVDNRALLAERVKLDRPLSKLQQIIFPN